MKKILLLAVIILAASGCNEDPTPGTPYNGPDYVYINASSPETTVSVWGNGYFQNKDEVSIEYVVKAIGNIYDHDRSFKVKVYSDSQMPPADVMTLDQQLVIPANETEGKIVVKVFRNDEFYTNNLGYKASMTVELEQDNVFSVWPTNGTTKIKYNLSVSELYNP